MRAKKGSVNSEERERKTVETRPQTDCNGGLMDPIGRSKRFIMMTVMVSLKRRSNGLPRGEWAFIEVPSWRVAEADEDTPHVGPLLWGMAHLNRNEPVHPMHLGCLRTTNRLRQ
jgi:hypothetical protein